MSRKNIAVEASSLLVVTMGEVEAPLEKLVDTINEGVSGSLIELRELQRRLVLVSRDATAAACSLFTLIRLAETRTEIQQAIGKRGE